MTDPQYAGPTTPRARRRGLNWGKLAPVLSTAVICTLMIAACAYRYDNFLSLQVMLNLLGDNAFLGVIAVGMTFVILSGGIDLSVGAVMGMTTMIVAVLCQEYHFHPLTAIGVGLASGAALGATMGCIIQFFELAPFLVTLGGMFFARGLTFVIKTAAVSIDHEYYSWLSQLGWEFNVRGETGLLTASAIIFLGTVLVAALLAHFTRFGRNVYAIGGSEASAKLMGLPVGRTKILVYTLSGLCAAMGGVLNTFYTLSGNPNAGVGLELDAIAAVVIGGTLLSGGVGYVSGTMLGILILGIIQTAITFQGNLSSWWTKIAIGLLLFVFISLQKLLTGTTGLRRQSH
jgi:simple sugar transport system permease protein